MLQPIDVGPKRTDRAGSRSAEGLSRDGLANALKLVEDGM
jgi:hypothetical protein